MSQSQFRIQKRSHIFNSQRDYTTTLGPSLITELSYSLECSSYYQSRTCVHGEKKVTQTFTKKNCPKFCSLYFKY